MARVGGATHVLVPPKDLVQGRSTFGLFVKIGGRRFEFEFSWNGKHEYYSLTILRDGRGRVARLYPHADEEYDIIGFNPRNEEYPNASIMIQTVKGPYLSDITPETLGSKHSVVIHEWGDV